MEEQLVHQSISENDDNESTFVPPITMKGIVYECHVCDKIFVYKNQLDDHLQLHDGIKPFTCMYCNQQFARVESFNIHKRIHGEYSNEQTRDESSVWNISDVMEYKSPFKCGFCEKSFTLRRQLKSHLPVHTKPFVCSVCGKGFARQYVCKNHIKSHTMGTPEEKKYNELNKERSYVCGFCKKKFTSVILLNEHLEQHMVEKSLNDDSVSIMQELNIVDSEENSNNDTTLNETSDFKCELCTEVRPHTHVEVEYGTDEKMDMESGDACLETDNFNYEDAEAAIEHENAEIKTEVRYQCQFCEETFPSKWQRSDHKRLHVSQKRFTCHVCGKKFFRRADCNMHYRIHTGERRFSCEVCQKTFLKNWNLKIHMLSHRHPKRERKNKNLAFKCEHCEKSFAWVSGLNRHRRTHTGEKPFSCDVCHKQFTRGHQARMHQNSHFSNERPFKCITCGKDYSRQESLKIHRRMCHPEEEIYDPNNEKPKRYDCDFCPRTFTMKSRLRTHVRIHTGERPFKCTMCDKTYLYLYGLTLHMSTHTGQKPYHCEECPMKFAAPGTLKRHMRTHTGETPYSCERCGKSYGQTNNLRAHEKKCLKL